MLTSDQLFLHTLEDLERRVPLGRGEYDAMMSAWLLRKLLVDRTSLIDQVNNALPSRKLKIKYEVVDVEFPSTAHGGS